VKQLHLDEIIERIENAFGDEMPFSERSLTEEDIDALRRVFGDQGYQCYLQDQVNRQIIRDYLTNAVYLGFITEERLAALSEQLTTEAGRSALSLHMLMRSVEEANDLPPENTPQELEALSPGPDDRPHMRLVRS